MALIGLKYPIFAPVEKYESGVIPTVNKSDAFILGKLITADKEAKFSTNPLYGDNETAEDISIFEEGTIKINVDDMTLESQSKLFGHAYTAADTGTPEMLEKGANDIPAYGVLGYYKTRFKNNKRSYEATLIYKTKFSPPKESAKTKEKSISWGTYESDGTFEPLTGFENEPYEKVVRFDTEDECKAWLDKFFALDNAEA
ncbi:MAG: major tail protein [Oscillospiraceae bacterium]